MEPPTQSATRADRSTDSAMDRLRPLTRVRQVRDFDTEPVGEAELYAITEVARWTGSASNRQPWRFLVVRDEPTLRAMAEVGLGQLRSLRTATAAIAIVLPDDPGRELLHAYDDGRAAERILVAANLLGLGAAIGWVRAEVRGAIGAILGLPEGTCGRSSRWATRARRAGARSRRRGRRACPART